MKIYETLSFEFLDLEVQVTNEDEEEMFLKSLLKDNVTFDRK